MIFTFVDLLATAWVSMSIQMGHDAEGARSRNRHACAACKHQRNKCGDNCMLGQYFPANMVEEFQAVRRIFGTSNLKKMLAGLDAQQKEEAIKSCIWEASMWQRNPAQGPLGVHRKLEQEVESLRTQLNRQIGILPYSNSAIYSDNTGGQLIGNQGFPTALIPYNTVLGFPADQLEYLRSLESEESRRADRYLAVSTTISPSLGIPMAAGNHGMGQGQHTTNRQGNHIASTFEVDDRMFSFGPVPYPHPPAHQDPDYFL